MIDRHRVTQHKNVVPPLGIEAHRVVPHVRLHGGEAVLQVECRKDAKGRLGAGQDVRCARLWQVKDLAVRRQDDQPGVVHADKSGHAVVEGCLRRNIGVAFAHLVAVGQRRLVTVVSIGDDQVARGSDLGGHRVDHVWVVHAPQLLPDLLLIHLARIDSWGAAPDRRVQYGGDAIARIWVEQDDLADVDLQRPQEPQAVGRGLGVSALVGEHDPIFKGAQCKRGDESLARTLGPIQVEGLMVDIESRPGLTDQDLLGAPEFIVGACARVDVGSIEPVGAVTGQGSALGDPDHVVGVQIIVAFLQAVADTVVRLAQNEGRVYFLSVIAYCAERSDRGHGLPVRPSSRITLGDAMPGPRCRLSAPTAR